VASRARRIDTRRMFAFLAGSFVLASRVCARSRTSRRGGGNVRHSASNHLDQLNTFLSRRRSRAKKRHAFRLKSSMCVHVQGSKRGVARRSSDEHRPPEFDHSKGLGRAEFKGNRRGASKSIGRGQSERPFAKSKKTEAYAVSCCERKKVEMLFAHLKRILRLDRLRLRGPSGARDEFLLAATAQNLRKLAKLITLPAPEVTTAEHGRKFALTLRRR
jgi:hypothetical protein